MMGIRHPAENNIPGGKLEASFCNWLSTVIGICYNISHENIHYWIYAQVVTLYSLRGRPFDSGGGLWFFVKKKIVQQISENK